MVTVVLLVTLRLAIGCHFFYEGVWKIKHADEFSAEPFLTAAKGPAAPLFYAMVYDLNGRQRLEVEDVATAGELTAAWKKVRDDSETRYGARLKKAGMDQETIDQAVEQFRQATRECFFSHKAKLEEYLEIRENDMAAYFAADQRESTDTVRTWLSEIGAIEQEYFQALKDYAEEDPNAQDAQGAVGRSAVASVPSLEKDDKIQRLIADKTRRDADDRKLLDVSVTNPAAKIVVFHVGPGIKGRVTLTAWDELRGEMVGEYGLNEQQQAQTLDVYREYEAVLRQYLADNTQDVSAYFGSLERFQDEQQHGNRGAAFQQQRARSHMMELRGEVKTWLAAVDELDRAYREALWQTLTDEQKGLGELPEGATLVDLLGWMLTWGLTAIGLCLLLGLCTRLACLGGAAFLFSVLLTQPPWPTIYPPAPPAVGHALLVDKNFVEMVAMLVLATTAVGRWGGLDHFVYRYLGQPLLKRLR